MRKTYLFAIAAAFVVAGVAGWAAPTQRAGRPVDRPWD